MHFFLLSAFQAYQVTWCSCFFLLLVSDCNFLNIFMKFVNIWVVPLKVVLLFILCFLFFWNSHYMGIEVFNFVSRISVIHRLSNSYFLSGIGALSSLLSTEFSTFHLLCPAFCQTHQMHSLFCIYSFWHLNLILFLYSLILSA